MNKKILIAITKIVLFQITVLNAAQPSYEVQSFTYSFRQVGLNFETEYDYALKHKEDNQWILTGGYDTGGGSNVKEIPLYTDHQDFFLQQTNPFIISREATDKNNFAGIECLNITAVQGPEDTKPRALIITPEYYKIVLGAQFKDTLWKQSKNNVCYLFVPLPDAIVCDKQYVCSVQFNIRTKERMFSRSTLLCMRGDSIKQLIADAHAMLTVFHENFRPQILQREREKNLWRIEEPINTADGNNDPVSIQTGECTLKEKANDQKSDEEITDQKITDQKITDQKITKIAPKNETTWNKPLWYLGGALSIVIIALLLNTLKNRVNIK